MNRFQDSNDQGDLTIGSALTEAAGRIADSSETPHLDAELLLGHVLVASRTWLHTWPEHRLSGQQQAVFRRLVTRRQHGEPVSYLTGVREFWSLRLKVNRHTLIPRPETELLVEQALAQIPEQEAWTVIDAGTGCGAIAISIARERPACRMIATDISAQALEVAAHNAAMHGVPAIEFHRGHWLEPLRNTRAQLIVCNPPYIADSDPHLVHGDVRFEPRAALAAGSTGLEAIRELVTTARDILQAPGWLLLEHGHDQQTAVMHCLEDAGYRDRQGWRDLGGNPRTVTARCG